MKNFLEHSVVDLNWQKKESKSLKIFLSVYLSIYLSISRNKKDEKKKNEKS